MRTLIVCYSRTGTTKKLADTISAALHADVEVIVDTKKRSGLIGWIMAGKDGSSEALTIIEKTKHDPGEYDIVLIGTPIWAGKMSAPIRTYLMQKSEYIKKIAFFITTASGEVDQCFLGMEQVCGKRPVAKLYLTTKQVRAGDISDEVETFVGELSEGAGSEENEP